MRTKSSRTNGEPNWQTRGLVKMSITTLSLLNIAREDKGVMLLHIQLTSPHQNNIFTVQTNLRVRKRPLKISLSTKPAVTFPGHDRRQIYQLVSIWIGTQSRSTPKILIKEKSSPYLVRSNRSKIKILAELIRSHTSKSSRPTVQDHPWSFSTLGRRVSSNHSEPTKCNLLTFPTPCIQDSEGIAFIPISRDRVVN